jgi:hypothetical protein
MIKATTAAKVNVKRCIDYEDFRHTERGKYAVRARAA